ncbi:hypothetical protein C815_01095 [Firmicutes bacterium M10-2]|nr:hypothetical protein C815_01095 [Firmicutes bacterium M10-2]
MLDDKEIQEIIEPIIEVLKSLEKELGSTHLMEVPSIHFVRNEQTADFLLGTHQLDEESIQQIEEYLQQEIESMYHPTILH